MWPLDGKATIGRAVFTECEMWILYQGVGGGERAVGDSCDMQKGTALSDNLKVPWQPQTEAPTESWTQLRRSARSAPLWSISALSLRPVITGPKGIPNKTWTIQV